MQRRRWHKSGAAAKEGKDGGGEKVSSRAATLSKKKRSHDATARRVVPLRLQALGAESLSIVAFSDARDAGEALDWLATALPAARRAGGANGGVAALGAGGAVGSAAVVVPESALLAVPPPAGSTVDQPWAALEATAPGAGAGGAPGAAALAALGSTLSDSGVRWRTLPAAEAQTILLVHEEDLPAAAVALARAGHAVSPPQRVCLAMPEEDPLASERNSQYVGVWSLLKREQPVGVTVEEHAAGEGPLRMQAPSGVFAEIRIPQQVDSALMQESSAGYHAVVEVSGGRRLSVRQRMVDFRPPNGCVLCTQVKFDREVMGELSHPRGRCREEYIEAWARVSAGPMAALELVAESPAVQNDAVRARSGYWIFCGDRFARVVGPPRGDGLVAGACCGSLSQLEGICGARAVREELRTVYEACWGTIESPGRLRISRQAWLSEKSGEIFYDAVNGIGGTITYTGHEVVHRLPTGVEQRWRVRDWGFNPFTPPVPAAPPVVPPEATANAFGASVAEPAKPGASESSSRSASRSSSKTVKADSPVAEPAAASRSRSKASKAASGKASRSRSASASPSTRPGSSSGDASRSKQRHRRRRKHRRHRGEQDNQSRARSRRRRHKHSRRRRRRDKSGSAPGSRPASPPPGHAAAYPYGPYPPQGAPGRPMPPGYPYGLGPDAGMPRRPPGAPDGMGPAFPGPPPGMPPMGYGSPPGYPPGPPGFAQGPGGYGQPPGFPAPPPGVWSLAGVPKAGPSSGQCAPMPGRPPGALALPSDPVAAFVADNKIDSLAEDALRALPPDLQQKVLGEGPVTGANPSAVLMGRIRSVEQRPKDGDRAVDGGGSGPAQGNESSQGPAAPGAGDSIAAVAAGAKLLPRAPGPPIPLPMPAGPPPGPAPAAPPGALAGSPRPEAAGSAWGDPVGSGWGDPVPRRNEAQQAPHQAPQHMPPNMNPGGWPAADGRVEWFCRQYGIDAGAERVLRQLHPQAQQRVLDEGPVGGGGANPSLELMNRIHRIETWEHSLHVSAFLTHNFVDAIAGDALRRLPVEAQRAVMGYGPLLSADRSQELLTRIRDVAGRAREGVDGGDAVSQFASENAIDASAETALRALPPELQQRVLIEGAVRGTKNPSAVLMSRIKRARTPALGDAPRCSRSRSRSRSASRRRSRERGGPEEAAAAPGAGLGPQAL